MLKVKLYRMSLEVVSQDLNSQMYYSVESARTLKITESFFIWSRCVLSNDKSA